MIINLLCPTRGRPDKFKRMVDSAMNKASNPNLVFIYSGHYCNDASSHDPLPTHRNFPIRLGETSGKGAGPYWNQLAAEASYHRSGMLYLYMLIGDDCVFETQGWDDMIRAEAAKYPDGIFTIAPNDNRTNGGAPHFVVSNKWIETLGYFVNPAFQHFCVDTWTEYLARAVDRFIYMPDVIVSHQKAAEQHYDETADRIRGKNRVSQRDNLIKDLLIANGFAQDDINLLKAVMHG